MSSLTRLKGTTIAKQSGQATPQGKGLFPTRDPSGAISSDSEKCPSVSTFVQHVC